MTMRNNPAQDLSDGPKPWSPTVSLSQSEEKACRAHYATVIEFSFGRGGTSTSTKTPPVYDLLYGIGPNAILDKHRYPLADGMRCFRWYHIPANNMTWCKDLIYKIHENAYIGSIESINEEWYKREHRGFTPHSRFIRPTSREIQNGLLSDGRSKAQGTMHLFMPFIQQDVIKQAHNIHSRLSSMTELAGASSNAMLLGGYPNLHMRRTLDQYFNTAIEDTSARDLDQVIRRVQQKRGLSAINEVPKIIVVDQLWLWILNDECVVSCFPETQRRGDYDLANRGDLLGTIVKSAYISTSRTVYELAARIAHFCIDAFSYERVSQAIETSKIVDMYDEALQILSADGKELYHRAIIITNRLNTASMNEQQQILLTLTSRELENQMLTELRDIRDELEIISLLQEDQRRVIRDMATTIGREEDQNFQAAYRRLQHEIEDQVIDVANLLKLAAKILVDINQTVELKQNAIIANEAQYSLTTSRSLAAESSKQGKIILLFTVVTIIFLPMSFLAAFFAIPIVEYPKAADGSSGLHLFWVCQYVFGITAAVAVPLITMGFNFERIKRWWALTLLRYEKLRGREAPAAIVIKIEDV